MAEINANVICILLRNITFSCRSYVGRVYRMRSVAVSYSYHHLPSEINKINAFSKETTLYQSNRDCVLL